jgi:hypothetical protein
MSQHPLPELTRWSAIEDPDQRLRTALREMYAWFARGESMLERTTRDVALVPALRPSMEAFAQWCDVAADVIVRGRPESAARRRRTRAAVGHALAFETWRSLVRKHGLSVRAASELMEALVGRVGPGSDRSA